MAKKQSGRLATQHKKSQGVVGIFGVGAKKHDLKVGDVSKCVMKKLAEDYPKLSFRHRKSITKKEINEALQAVDGSLGQTLFVDKSSIKPDGGIIEVKDDHDRWRVVLVSEAKYQGKDVQNIEAGNRVGKDGNQDLMVAGNAIERSHKNISEIANFMLSESHFPYVLFLQGSNFLTETVSVERPDSRIVTLDYQSGTLNRLDRLTSANYGLPINSNLCQNRTVAHRENTIMLQAASIYTQGAGGVWDPEEMANVMLDVAKISLKVLGSDLFDQLT